jgi:hypothetical protein
MPSIERNSFGSPPENLSEEERAKKEFPDFFQFCRENTSYLRFFNHKPTYKNGEPQILLEGVLTPWSEAKPKIFGDKPLVSLKIPHGWKYNANGIVHKDMIHWNKLEPDWKDPEPQPGHYFIEIVSKQRGFLGLSRHCWVRLIDAESNVISVGFGGKVLKCGTFRSQKGKFVSPDVGEFEDGIEHKTRIVISKKDHDNIKERIEFDQKTKNVYFNMITRNCSMYACALLKEIGITIDNREFPTQALARWFFKKLGVNINLTVLKVINYAAFIFRILLSPFYLILILALGAGYSDNAILKIEKEHGKDWPEKPVRPFQHFSSLFNCANFNFGTGWKVTEWQQTVQEWREKQYHNELSQIALARRMALTPITAEQEEYFKNRLFQAKYGFPPKVEATPLGFQISPLELVKEWSP